VVGKEEVDRQQKAQEDPIEWEKKVDQKMEDYLKSKAGDRFTQEMLEAIEQAAIIMTHRQLDRQRLYQNEAWGRPYVEMELEGVQDMIINKTLVRMDDRGLLRDLLRMNDSYKAWDMRKEKEARGSYEEEALTVEQRRIALHGGLEASIVKAWDLLRRQISSESLVAREIGDFTEEFQDAYLEGALPQFLRWPLIMLRVLEFTLMAPQNMDFLVHVRIDPTEAMEQILPAAQSLTEFAQSIWNERA
jgi:hypothetical protein